MKLIWPILAAASFGAGSSLTDSTRETGQVFFWHSEVPAGVFDSTFEPTSSSLAYVAVDLDQPRYRF